MSDVHKVFNVGTISLFIQLLLESENSLIKQWTTMSICAVLQKIYVELFLWAKFPKVGVAKE